MKEINVIYQPDWDLEVFTYKNYGISLTKEQSRKAFAQFLYCLRNYVKEEKPNNI